MLRQGGWWAGKGCRRRAGRKRSTSARRFRAVAVWRFDFLDASATCSRYVSRPDGVCGVQASYIPPAGRRRPARLKLHWGRNYVNGKYMVTPKARGRGFANGSTTFPSWCRASLRTYSARRVETPRLRGNIRRLRLPSRPSTSCAFGSLDVRRYSPALEERVLDENTPQRGGII